MNERILVLSDCHLTSGINHETGVWSPTEDFFWDKEFVEFLEHYSNERTTLILNGDFFDFMQVLVFPTAAEMEEYNISENEINHVYGLRCTESSCAFQINKVIDGHIDLFKGLADFIQKENRIKILKGNHDIQLTWNKVQEQMINRLAGFCSPTKKHLVQSNLEFLPWFYLIPGLLYVEHGNQYEYTTSFRNFLNPYLPFDYEEASKQIELDLSSFLVRYFTNRIEPINPLADNIRPLSKFYQIFWRTNPFVFISTLSYALRYVLKAFKKSRELLRISKNDIYSEIEQKNMDMIKEEALKIYPDDEVKSKELTDHLISFDARKADPVLTSGAWRFVWNMIKIPLKNILWLIPLYLLTFIPNLTDSIIETIKHSESSPWNSILETLLQFKIPQIILIVIVAFILIVLLQKVRRNSTKPKNDEDDIIVKIREDARFIASKLEVKYVTFGHTHYPDIVKLDNNRWYFNSGTWMSLLAEKEQIYRDLQQFSFLKIENEKAELLSWKTGSKTARPVTVVDTNQPHTSKEDSIIKLIFSLFSRR